MNLHHFISSFHLDITILWSVTNISHIWWSSRLYALYRGQCMHSLKLFVIANNNRLCEFQGGHCHPSPKYSRTASFNLPGPAIIKPTELDTRIKVQLKITLLSVNYYYIDASYILMASLSFSMIFFLSIIGFKGNKLSSLCQVIAPEMKQPEEVWVQKLHKFHHEGGY